MDREFREMMVPVTTPVDFKNLVTLREKTISRDTIVFTSKTIKWCRLPYPGHPKGCPNYGLNDCCPPRHEYHPEMLDDYVRFTLVYATFDFASYRAIRKEQHSGWTEAQVRNVLYWQGSVKKMLKEYIAEHHVGTYDDLLGAGSGFWNRPSMESAGIYVFGTLKNNGIPFEVKPINTVVMVSLLLSKNGNRVPRAGSLDAFLSSNVPVDSNEKRLKKIHVPEVPRS